MTSFYEDQKNAVVIHARAMLAELENRQSALDSDAEAAMALHRDRLADLSRRGANIASHRAVLVNVVATMTAEDVAPRDRVA